jgi:hypothetical protein
VSALIKAGASFLLFSVRHNTNDIIEIYDEGKNMTCTHTHTYNNKLIRSHHRDVKGGMSSSSLSLVHRFIILLFGFIVLEFP